MERKSINPFGLEVIATEPLLSLQAHVVRQWVASDEAVVLRGLPTSAAGQHPIALFYGENHCLFAKDSSSRVPDR